ncbi:hypothetical protein [Streptomyces sioyaensis]|uniref:hypothetical protein n=1 Tax=Streptomyces sioyaensis TaxID=67364 RepID=UPI0037ADE0D1
MRLTTGRARLTNALGDHGKRLARFAAAGQEADFVRVSIKVGSSAPGAAAAVAAGVLMPRPTGADTAWWPGMFAGQAERNRATLGRGPA